MNENDGMLLIRVEEAARRLSLSRATLYAAIKRGDLRIVKIGSSTRIAVADMELWVEGLRQ